MTTMKFKVTVELNYEQMEELLSILAKQNTTDQELNASFMLHGNYGTYHYQVDKDGNISVLKIEK